MNDSSPSSPPRQPTPPRGSLLIRAAWNSGGLLACGVGFVGLAVPGLPSVVFFIVAFACFSRGSERLRDWVLSLPRIGPVVRDYYAGLGMPRHAKYWAVGFMAVFVAVGSLAIPHWWQVALAVAGATIGASWIWFLVPTREDLLAQAPTTAPRDPSA